MVLNQKMASKSLLVTNYSYYMVTATITFVFKQKYLLSLEQPLVKNYPLVKTFKLYKRIFPKGFLKFLVLFQAINR